jgi:hypothetical protein
MASATKARAAGGMIMLLCFAWPAVGGDASFDPTRIVGKIRREDGKPFAGAVVSILSVEPRAGPGLASPWCYPDCGRHAVTKADGLFEIGGLDDRCAFTLSVEGKGYLPEFFITDPLLGGPANIRLEAPRSSAQDTDHCVTGQILDSRGGPAVGMRITVRDYRFRGLPSVGGQLDLTATTDDEGRFTLVSEQQLEKLSVTLDTKGTLNQRVFALKPGDHENTLQLLEGTTVKGRVLKMAKPVAGVTVGIAGLAPTYGEFSGTYEATTDGDGRFAISDVYPDRDFYLFTRMTSVGAENLAAIRQRFRSWRDGQTTEVAELNLYPAHRVRGQLVFSDGKPAPRDIRVVLSRAEVFDSQETVADREGRFLFEGVPSESVVLSFHSPDLTFVRGYRLSPQHFNLDYLRRTALCGRVDDDIDLVVLFEPGEAPANGIPQPFAAGARFRPEDPLFVKQKRLEAEPLRGISTDVHARAPK